VGQRVTDLLLCIIALLVVVIGANIRALQRIKQRLRSPHPSRPRTLLDSAAAKTPVVGRLTEEILRELDALIQSEDDHRTRYKILTDNAAAAVMLHEADGTINWCSPFTEVLTGFPLSAIYKDRVSFLRANAHEDDKGLIERALAIVSTGEPFQCRYRFYHKSGMTLWLETRTVPIFDSESSQYAALSITLDVTASVINQMQIEERNRDLHEFTYMISHDLKAPISTIKGMLGILEEERLETHAPECKEPIDYISKATIRLEQLVEGVLELAKISSSERSLDRVDTNAVLTDVADDYRRQFDDTGALLDIASDLPPTLGNRTQLYQIFSNLVGNALKYRSAERPLIVSIGSRSAPSRRKVRLTVTDTGRGIPHDKLDLIFKPFNRAGEEAIQGTGVGLACVKRLVEKVGGSLSVESTEGVGTTFTLELRRAPEQ
jgi:PAS domain S-box-containing protein